MSENTTEKKITAEKLGTFLANAKKVGLSGEKTAELLGISGSVDSFNCLVSNLKSSGPELSALRQAVDAFLTNRRKK